MSFEIDVPQVAYKTWVIEYRVINENGTRNRDMEMEFESTLKNTLSDYQYSSDHDHVK